MVVFLTVGKLTEVWAWSPWNGTPFNLAHGQLPILKVRPLLLTYTLHRVDPMKAYHPVHGVTDLKRGLDVWIQSTG